MDLLLLLLRPGEVIALWIRVIVKLSWPHRLVDAMIEQILSNLYGNYISIELKLIVVMIMIVEAKVPLKYLTQFPLDKILNLIDQPIIGSSYVEDIKWLRNGRSCRDRPCICVLTVVVYVKEWRICRLTEPNRMSQRTHIWCRKEWM